MPPPGQIHPKAQYTLGVDLARLGEDSSVYVVIEKPFDDDALYVVYIEERKHKLLTDAIARIEWMNKKFNFKKILIDETGLGSGVVDVLRERNIGNIEPVTFTLNSKQMMYSNLLMLMEKKAKNQPGGINLPDHKKLLYQLADLRYELLGKKAEDGRVLDSPRMRIHHSDKGHDDFPDALALAAWGFKVGTMRNISWGVY